MRTSADLAQCKLLGVGGYRTAGRQGGCVLRRAGLSTFDEITTDLTKFGLRPRASRPLLPG